MSEVCREFGISRKTGYKIFNRCKDDGLEMLTDRSRGGSETQMAFDGEKFGKEVVGIVKAPLERTLSPQVARIEQLEARIQLLEGQAGTVKNKPVVRIAAGSRTAI